MSSIVFLGTSVTHGTAYGGVTSTDTFAHKIGTANGHPASGIINRGVLGDTTAGMVARLQSDVISLNPDVCVVECGANDFGYSVGVSTCENNAATIFRELSVAGIKTVCLNFPILIGPSSYFSGCRPYLEAIERQAALHGVPIVDMYREFTAAWLYLTYNEFISNFVDHVHLTVEGHQFVANLAAREKNAGYFAP